jgi:cell division protein FtsI/penicillin-binding protein 2
VSTGTARRVTGLRTHGVLAKTGTAEISAEDRSNNAWMAGYLTRRNPTLAFAAVAYDVPHGDHGGEVAGALVSDFLEAVYADPDLRQSYMPEASGR